ncbi:hypothetical protein IEQ34_008030 [Dendrobium chrysotoxum]|uniref:SET domain-containing protein n=1 Tax=Dendrobium chrysotoxum TaxID=161865 RepID=A0AAV7H778_DENCH|nr:hypothetical protein IEQ34_008030 [Dendrobium chrysotoxum]
MCEWTSDFGAVCRGMGTVQAVGFLQDSRMASPQKQKKIQKRMKEKGRVSLYVGFATFRCGDANIVEVPVEVETPDHHYYHLAFFTVRKVEALEELTWDYGIDFDDQTHPIKAFSCRCGSKLCRYRRAQISKFHEKDLPWFWDENAFKVL